MVESYLYIKNFGPIPELNITIRPFTIFIGSQGTGKSTIAKVLTIFNDYWFWDGIINQSPTLFEEFSLMGISKYFNEDTIIRFTKGDYVVGYKDKTFSITSLTDVSPLNIDLYLHKTLHQQ